MAENTPDSVFHLDAGTTEGWASTAVREAFAATLEQWPDIHFAAKDVRIGPDHVTLRRTVNATPRDHLDLPDSSTAAPSGRRGRLRCRRRARDRRWAHRPQGISTSTCSCSTSSQPSMSPPRREPRTTTEEASRRRTSSPGSRRLRQPAYDGLLPPHRAATGAGRTDVEPLVKPDRGTTPPAATSRRCSPRAGRARRRARPARRRANGLDRVPSQGEPRRPAAAVGCDDRSAEEDGPGDGACLDFRPDAAAGRGSETAGAARARHHATPGTLPRRDPFPSGFTPSQVRRTRRRCDTRPPPAGGR